MVLSGNSSVDFKDGEVHTVNKVIFFMSLQDLMIVG